MSREASTFGACDRLVREFENVIKRPIRGHSAACYTGVDLGTAYVVVSVPDEGLRPVASSYHYADMVRDGVVVDYVGAIRIVREMKEELEKKLGVELVYAATAIPPDIGALDSGAIKNVVQGTGFEIAAPPDEPAAANTVLNIRSSAVVDIEGGTTGVSVLRNEKVAYVTDEPTDGTHFSLVISGAYQLSFEEADAHKQDRKNHRELLPILKPVIEEVSAVISCHIEGRDVDGTYLVGGTCCLTGIEEIIEKKTGVPAYEPTNPMFVTSLGITKNYASACG